MNNTFLILPFFLLTVLGCKAQDKEPSDFIPKGYALFEKYFGDLNKDGLDDCVLIIKKTDTTNIVTNRFDKKVDRNRRGIVVLFKKEKGYEKDVSITRNEKDTQTIYLLWRLSKRARAKQSRSNRSAALQRPHRPTRLLVRQNARRLYLNYI